MVDPPEQTVLPNTPAKIRCRVPNKPDAAVQWRKRGGSLPAGVNPYDLTLVIPRTTEANEGYYICSTSDPVAGPLDSEPAKINVKKRMCRCV